MTKKQIQFIPKDPSLSSIYTPPIPAKTSIPNWYRDASSTINREELKIYPDGKRNGTYKKCVPFMDAIMAGYVVTLPADVLVSYDEKGEQIFQWMVEGNIVSIHGKKEHPNLPIPEGYSERVYTWIGQYIVKTPKGYSSLFTHPLNQYNYPFKVFSGVVDTDNFLSPVDSPFVIKKDFKGIIPMGTPICQIIPFKRDSWVSERKILSLEEINNWANSYLRKIHSAYKSSVWSRKNYE